MHQQRGIFIGDESVPAAHATIDTYTLTFAVRRDVERSLRTLSAVAAAEPSERPTISAHDGTRLHTYYHPKSVTVATDSVMGTPLRLRVGVVQ